MTEKKVVRVEAEVPVTSDKPVEKKAAVPVQTEAQKIWSEISGVELEMFSLPGQTVEKYCKPVTVEPTKLYVTATVQAVFPALETALRKKFTVEMAQKFIVIARKKDE